MKECYAVQITYGEYEDRTSENLAVFTDKELAVRWMSSIDTLLHYAIADAKERELRDEYSQINYSLFGIERVQRVIKFGEWHIKEGYSLDIETLPLL